MTKKLTQYDAEQSFLSKGWQLQDVYINNKAKLTCVCPNGHKQTISLSSFYKCSTCKYCKEQDRLNFISAKFKNKEFTLLSTSYINSVTKLNYRCKRGHEHSMTYHDFSAGIGCPYCVGLAKLTHEFVKDAFDKKGYKLLSEYINSKTKLDYICDKGHRHSITWSGFKEGHGCNTCWFERCGESSYKGGVTKNNLPLYETYAPKLEKYQSVYKIIQDGLELLGVECTYCNKIFIPSQNSVSNKVSAIRGTQYGDCNLYCSSECKDSCPTYKQVWYLKGQNPNKNLRSNQASWASLVKERDNNTCQKCGVIEDIMYAHHIIPVVESPIESADIDNGVTYCESCHLKAHKLPGCGNHELQCKTK